MTARATVSLAAAAAVMLALLVAKVMAVSTLAGTLLLCALGIAGLCLTARLIGPARGEHAVQRELTAEDKDDIKWLADVRKAVISRPKTEHEPPWEPAPVWDGEPQTVIEPDAVTHGPPQPEPEAIIIAAGTISGGRLTSVRAAVLPPLPQCPALPQWVTDILGADSVDGAMTEISRVAHSFESNFTKGDARYVRALTDGAS